MLTQNDILTFLRTNKDLFRNQFCIIKIGVFGSFARNEQTENSDIDIIIEMQSGTENIFEKRIQLKEFLSKHFSKEVDVCHKNALKKTIQELVLKDVIYV